MSQHATQTLTCPQCRARVPWEIHSSVNVTRDPALKLRVLTNELGRFTCPQCGAMAYLTQPLLYHDMDLQLMIQLAPATFDPTSLGAELQALVAAMTTRLVGSWNELREKVLLFDARLDDRPVEVMKLLARAQMKETPEAELYFEEVDAEHLHFTLLLENGPESLMLPLAAYKNVHARLSKAGLLADDREAWLRADQRYAANMLQLLSASSSTVQ